MFVTVNSLLELQVQLTTCLNKSPVIILAVENSSTSLTTVRSFLDSKRIQYFVVPISSFHHLQTQLQSLETQQDTVHNVICLDCGSVFDIEQICPFLRNVDCFVYRCKSISREEGLTEIYRKELFRAVESDILAAATVISILAEGRTEETKSLKRGREEEAEFHPKRIKRDYSQVDRSVPTEWDPTLVNHANTEGYWTKIQDEVEFDREKFHRLVRYLTKKDSDDSESEEAVKCELKDWFISVIERSDIAIATEAMEMLITFLNLRFRPIVFLGIHVVNTFTERYPDSLEALKALIDLGDYFYYYGDPSAMDYYRRAQEICDRNFPDSIERAYTASRLGETYLVETEEDEFRDTKWVSELLDSYRIYSKVGPNAYNKVVTLGRLSSFYRRLKRYEEAEVSLLAALATESLDIDGDDIEYAVTCLRKMYSE